MKVVTIEALFPEMKGGRCHQQGRGRGSNVQAALCAAMRDLVKQKGLRKQRYSEFSATFTVGTVAPALEVEPTQPQCTKRVVPEYVESQSKDGIGGY